jgi:UDP-glucose 4-epimerase
MYFNLERLSKFFGKLICIGSGAEFNVKNYVPKMKEDYFNKHVPSKDDIYGFSKYEIAKDILKKKRNIFNLRDFWNFWKIRRLQKKINIK